MDFVGLEFFVSEETNNVEAHAPHCRVANAMIIIIMVLRRSKRNGIHLPTHPPTHSPAHPSTYPTHPTRPLLSCFQEKARAANVFTADDILARAQVTFRWDGWSSDQVCVFFYVGTYVGVAFCFGTICFSERLNSLREKLPVNVIGVLSRGTIIVKRTNYC